MRARYIELKSPARAMWVEQVSEADCARIHHPLLQLFEDAFDAFKDRMFSDEYREIVAILKEFLARAFGESEISFTKGGSGTAITVSKGVWGISTLAVDQQFKRTTVKKRAEYVTVFGDTGDAGKRGLIAIGVAMVSAHAHKKTLFNRPIREIRTNSNATRGPAAGGVRTVIGLSHTPMPRTECQKNATLAIPDRDSASRVKNFPVFSDDIDLLGPDLRLQSKVDVKNRIPIPAQWRVATGEAIVRP